MMLLKNVYISELHKHALSIEQKTGKKLQPGPARGTGDLGGRLWHQLLEGSLINNGYIYIFRL